MMGIKTRLDRLEQKSGAGDPVRVVVVWGPDDVPDPEPGEVVQVLTWEDVPGLGVNNDRD